MTILPALLRAGARPRGRLLHVRRAVVVAAPIETVFAFFADAANLQRLTPPWLHFHIQTRMPLTMEEGTLVDYSIRLHGVPMPWRSRIDRWQPGVSFVDRQLIGPYRWWHHEHRFESVSGGTRVIDHVEYVPRARYFTAGLVARQLERIFDYRTAALASLF